MVARAINQEKERKGIQTGKEEEKVYLFEGDMILSVENLQVSKRKLLQPNKQIQLGSRKLNTRKSAAFVYTNKKQ